MAFNKFQDFLGGLVARQRDRFSKNGAPDIDVLLARLMGNTGEVSAIVAARELLDMYKGLDERLIGAAEMSVTAHLIDLEKRGMAARDGDIWQAT